MGQRGETVIAGIGTDIAETERIEGTLKRFGDTFKTRVFSAREQAILAERSDCGAFCAGRWAAKEAVAKALGCGIGKGCAFTDVEILNDPVSGAPLAELGGAAAETLQKRGGGKIWITLSHERAYAVATAVWEQ